MDNKLNEIRRKIRTLRAEMLGLADTIRDQMRRDEDCAGGSLRLMAMRGEILELISRRNAMGGREEGLGVVHRLKPDYRSPEKRKAPLRGTIARRER